eukprot:180432_1
MSVDDMYPANQWRYHHRHNRARSAPRQPHHQYNRRRHCRRNPLGSRLGMGAPGARLGVIGLMNMFSSSSINPNRPTPTYSNTQSHTYNQQNKPIIIDIIKKGDMEIEYNILFKYYRKKYFLLKSDSKLYYYSNANAIYSKPDGIIHLIKVISLKKCDNNILELELNNKCDNGPPVDITKLLTPDTTIWRLKCNQKGIRNDWFDCIRCFVSQNKNVVYIEREKQNDNNESKCNDDEWCIIDKKDNELDLGVTQPDIHNDKNKCDEYIAPPAYAPGYDQNGNLRGDIEGNYNGNGDEYGDEGKITVQ